MRHSAYSFKIQFALLCLLHHRVAADAKETRSPITLGRY
jgi:hypothetical protein